MTDAPTLGIPLSNNDEAVLEQQLDLEDQLPRTAPADLAHVYELDETVERLTALGCTRVALQFPDSLLQDATALTEALQARLPQISFYVLGDTSYGSCCVDEVAAEHIDAQALVHYGRACLSPTAKLPIIYVLGRYPLDVDNLVSAVCSQDVAKETTLLLVSESSYMSSQEAVATALTLAGYSVATTALQTQTAQERQHGSTLPGRAYILQEGVTLADCNLLYVGPPSPTLTTTLMTHSARVQACYSFQPHTQVLREETQQNAQLRRRYAVVLKARDAGVIGIVVGTLGVAGYRPLIRHLQARIRAAGKKPYLFAMGKLNPAKMANFAEVDLFVLVSCGEHTLLMDGARQFYKPIATPFEVLLALSARNQASVAWTGHWVTDFAALLAMPTSDVQATSEDEDEEADPDAPHFSLLTGGYAVQARPMRAVSHATDQDAALLRQSGETQVGFVGGVLSPAAAYLNTQKRWTGLGKDHAAAAEREEDDSVGVASSTLTEGRTGVARGYH